MLVAEKCAPPALGEITGSWSQRSATGPTVTCHQSYDIGLGAASEKMRGGMYRGITHACAGRQPVKGGGRAPNADAVRHG